MKPQVTILGGGYAGLLTALRLARRARGRLDVRLINGSELFVERVRQHQAAIGARLDELSLPRLLAGTGVSFVAGHVEGIDLARGELHARGQRLGFDELVLAVGSRVERSAVPGAREHAFSLDADAVPALHERLRSAQSSGGSVVVVGGGLSGIELATELAERWPLLPVTLLSQSQIVPELSLRARDYIRQHLLQSGVRLHEGARVQQVERDAVWWAAGATSSAQRSAADVCIWAGGFIGSPLPRQAGLLVNAREQVLVDPSFRSLSHPQVAVVGDAAAVQGGAAGPLQLSCKVAMYAAPALADNLARRHLKLPGVPFVFSDGGVCISLGRRAGVIDRRWADGNPREQIISGRSGALLKEMICRYTVLRMRAESTGLWPLAPLDRPRQLTTSDPRQLAA